MAASITYQSTNVHFKLKNQPRAKAWLKKIVRREGLKLVSLSYVFCSDKYLLKINKEYLGHSTLTDIITFDLAEGDAIDGEIYISTQRVKANSESYKVPFDQELLRVMVHGVLHLCGHKDKTVADKARMRGKEEACLSLY